ncbi:MAG: GxxExxY protein [Mucilaginibacter sp.]|nr:GxxExxY protein [Mucilaginibacter sp.]
MGNYENDELTEKIIDCCFEVHRLLVPGFIEKIYAMRYFCGRQGDS